VYEHAHLQHMTDAQARSQAARQWADARRAALLQKGRTFVSESVFSHVSKLQLIAQAKAAGFVVALHVVALDDPKQLVARVSQRVREGGHAVPREKILSRYPRTLDNLRQALLLVDVAYVYDARDLEHGGPQLVAVVAQGRVQQRLADFPPWVQQLVGDGVTK
jgi:predicted ABC-type ATPase